MTSASGTFVNDMPSASSASSPTPTETVVVINGLSTATMGPKGAVTNQRLTSSPSSSVAPPSSSVVSSGTSSSSSSLFTLVPSLTSSRQIAATTSSGESIQSSASSPSAKGGGGLVGSSSDSPQIIVVSEGDGSLDSTSNSGVGVAPSGGTATVNIGVGEAYVQAYPVYTVGDTTMYAASSTYYTTGTTPVTFSQDIVSSAAGGPILAPGTNTFIVHQDVDNDPSPMITPSRHSPQTDGGVTYMVSGDGGGGGGPAAAAAPSGEQGGGVGGTPNLDAEAQANIAHATRVSPVTVQWLLDNYETAEGVSLPRSTLYNHYLYHCADHKLDPVNSASFGKLIRSVFMGLRTRRLGTRGNSKYHYYGIRVKPNSSLNNLSEDGTPITFRHQGNHLKKSQSLQTSQEGSQHGQQQGRSYSSAEIQKGGGGGGGGNDSYDSRTQITAESSPQTIQNQQYLGDISRALPVLPDIQFVSQLSNGVSKQQIELFRSLYQEHCENILEVIYNLQFHLMEPVWKRFWSLGNNNVVVNSEKTNSSDASEEDEGELASKFPSNTLQNLLRLPSILEFMKKVDYQFYQNVVEVLIPDVLRSIPSALTQSIRNFAKSLETWLTNALVGYPAETVDVKITAVASLAQTLRRYTSLNHLAQAARAVLQNSSQITQMLSDLNRVDFHNVQEQASWVCQCDVGLVERLKEDFKATLQQQNSLEQWADWLQTVVDQTLVPQEGNPDFSKHARQFLLKWSFYSSMVIRDLTLRSAASFGSFHLIRLLYDEYMFYLVEHKVASSLGLTPIAVMSQFLSSSKVQNMNQGSLSMNGDESGAMPPIKRPKFEDS